MASAYLQPSQLRPYDEMVNIWLRTLNVDYGDIFKTPLPSASILTIYSSPERAFGTMNRALVRKGYLDPSNPGDGSGEGFDSVCSYRMVPNPFASFHRTSPPEFAADRSSWATFRNEVTQDLNGSPAGEQGMVFVADFPLPMEIPYQIDFWASKEYSIVWIQEWLFGQFHQRGCAPKEIMRTVELGPFYGTKLAPVIVNGISDTSELIDTEGEIMRRFTVDVIVKGWFLREPVDKPMMLYADFDWTLERVNPGSPVVTLDSENQEVTKFNLIPLTTWYLPETDTLSYIKTAGEVLDFMPAGSPNNVLRSPRVVMADADHRFVVRSRNTAPMVIEVLDAADAVVATETIPAVPSPAQTSRARVDFTGEGLYSIRITTDAFVSFEHLSVAQVTDAGD